MRMHQLKRILMTQNSFYEGLGHAFDHFPNYRMNILLGDFNTKLATEDVLKQTIWNERLYQDSKDCGVGVVKFAASKNKSL
jgi:hypothetical protein